MSSLEPLSIDFIDALISALSRWDKYEDYYLGSLLPRVVALGAAPPGSAIAASVSQLHARLTPDEWQQLPELVAWRRAGLLDEIESDAEMLQLRKEERRAAEEQERRLEQALAKRRERRESQQDYPVWMRANAYRTLRLSAGATLSDINTAATELRRAAKLGLRPGGGSRNPTLYGTLAVTETDVRSAVGHLSDVGLRAQDRLFWFHDVDSLLDDVRPPTRDAVDENRIEEPVRKSHDEALGCLLAASHAGVTDEGLSSWVAALGLWQKLVADEDYWTLSLELDDLGGFEPTVHSRDTAALRRRAVRLAAEPLIEAARHAFATDDNSTVKRIVAALGDLEHTGSWAAAAKSEILAPASERLHAVCASISKDLRERVVRVGQSDAYTRRNRDVSCAAQKRFENEALPLLGKLTATAPSGRSDTLWSNEEAARCAFEIACAYTWAEGSWAACEMYDRALELAEGLPLAFRIEASRREYFGLSEPESGR